MKLIFMGTPEFAVPVLQALIDSEHEVMAVVTQPDKPKGRGKSFQAPPVKELAMQYDIPVLQPEKVRDEEFMEQVRLLAPDAAIVAAYGKILPKSFLEMPRFGCINVHASLLPAYRGAAPIQRMVMDGAEEAGVTIMQMDAGVDTGDILKQVKVEMDPGETAGTLTEKLSAAGSAALIDVLEEVGSGRAVPVPQEGESNYASMITREESFLDFSAPAAKLERQIRGLSPKPGASAFLDGKNFKFWLADVGEAEEGIPGEVVRVEKRSFAIVTGEGTLVIRELQPEGKKRMDTAAFLRGTSLKEGAVFTNHR